MRIPAFTLRPLAAVLALLVAGCYSYTPVENERPEAGQEVRIEVGEAMGEPARTYSGRILQVNDGTVVLSQAMARSPGDRGGLSRDQVIRIQHSRIRSVEKQEISFWKSASLIAGGGVAATVGLAALAGEFESDLGGSTGDDRDSGEATIVVPIPFP